LLLTEMISQISADSIMMCSMEKWLIVGIYVVAKFYSLRFFALFSE